MEILTKSSDNTKNSRFSKFIDKWIYIFLGFLCSAVLMLLAYYINEVIPFGDKTVLRMDLFHQYGPLFAEFFDRLTGFKSFFYSWNTGGGGAFLGNYFNYLSSPVGDLIALIAGHNHIPEAIGAMVLIKNALSASTLAYYLKQKFGKNDFSITAFGIMYAFCGFFIAYYWNVMWIDAMYLLPLIILGIEKIIDERKCKLYIIALAFSFFANYYMSYMICIFSIFYFLVHFISTSSFKESYSDIPVRTDENGNADSSTFNKIIYNKFLRSGVTFAASSVIAVALVAVAVVPTYLCLKTCSATSGTFPSEPSYYNDIWDFLANHLASLEPTIRSSGDTVLPNVYCGILTVMLIPLYLFCDKISAKTRASHVVFLAIFFLGFNLNYANYILHAFHFPNDLPFRFSFIYSFLLIKMGYEVIIHIRDFSSKAIIASGAGVLLFITAVQHFGMDNVDDATVYISVGFTALFTLVLQLMRKKEYAQSAVSLLLMCSVFAEVAIANIDHIKITQQKPNFVNGYSDFRALKEKLDNTEGNDDYRMELTYNNTIMDPSWFNYNGISVFSSMAYEKSANLQDRLGLDSNYINSYIYHSQTPVYNAMMSLKYLVKNDKDTPVNNQLFEFVARCGKFSAYRNKYWLPLAFSVGNDMTDFDPSGINPFEVQNDFWYYATGTFNILKAIDATDYEAENIEENPDFLTDSFTCSKMLSDGDGTLRIRYDVKESQNVYLYFDSSEIENISAYNTDKSFESNPNVDEPFILDCGYRKKGDTLTVEFTLDGEHDDASAECYVYGLDMNILDAGYEILSHGTMDIDTFEETHIKGTVDMAEDRMLFTSINYDDGWTVLVDGKEAEKIKIGDALIGLKLDAGKHEIEFKYVPQGLVIGAIISASALVIVIAFIALNSIFKKNKHKSKSTTPRKEYAEPDDTTPKGIDAMMIEDLGSDATVEEAEALLEPVDEYEGQLEKNAEGLVKVDELLNTQKLNLKEILEAAEAENLDNTEE